jgi:hypothetical protein
MHFHPTIRTWSYKYKNELERELPHFEGGLIRLTGFLSVFHLWPSSSVAYFVGG